MRTEMRDEVRRAAVFLGLMFVAVGALGVVASLRHGLNGLGVIVGLFGGVLLLAAHVSRPR